MELIGLEEKYVRVQTVNMCMAKRIRASDVEDASVNALALLDLLARLVPMTIGESLADIERVFDSFVQSEIGQNNHT